MIGFKKLSNPIPCSCVRGPFIIIFEVGFVTVMAYFCHYAIQYKTAKTVFFFHELLGVLDMEA